MTSSDDVLSATGAMQEIGDLSFGRPARCLWSLPDDVTPLNHGSFGACPRFVQRAQQRLKERLEDGPDRFFEENILPLSDSTPLRRVVAYSSQLVDAPTESLALVENATIGIDAVLRSLAIGAGDHILITNHNYGAVRLAVEDLCQRSGAKLDIAEIPIATTDEEILSRISSSILTATRLVIVDHIASITGLTFPVAEIVSLCRRKGVRILVDGAHAIGQIPLSLSRLDADWYVTNLHKWLFAPRGACFLYAGPEVAAITRPTIVSHFIGLGFPQSFDFVGTRDYSPWLAISAAVDFHDALGLPRIMAHARDMLDHATEQFRALGALPLGTGTSDGSMRSFKLPQSRALDAGDMPSLRDRLWQRHRIQAFTHSIDGHLIFRISAPPYVGREDIDRLVEVLAAEGWPARAGSACSLDTKGVK